MCSDRMWSLPISSAAAYIFLINSLRRDKGCVDGWTECGGGANPLACMREPCIVLEIEQVISSTGLLIREMYYSSQLFCKGQEWQDKLW